MAYSVKEIFYTLQGEGARTGRAAVFCRFAGCNLWSGREDDRADAACFFCDTDFVGTDGPGGGRFVSVADLARTLDAAWRDGACARETDAARDTAGRAVPYVVFTGGEPLLQLDQALIDACHALGFEVAVETNGTVTAPRGIDWLTVSPKPDAELVVRSGQELKLVYPHGVTPESVQDLDFEHFYLQPMDGPELSENSRRAIQYVRTHPRWRLSVQTHKLLGFP
jgi:7-carboxy-7-deazaguanine synthase (Cx14CxxC type)